MSRKRHSARDMVNKLRQACMELASGQTVAEVRQLPGVTEPTFCQSLMIFLLPQRLRRCFVRGVCSLWYRE